METKVFFYVKPCSNMLCKKFDRQLSRPEKEAYINQPNLVAIVELTETHSYYEVFRSPRSSNPLPQLRTTITNGKTDFLYALSQPGWPPPGTEFGETLEWDEFNQKLKELGFIQ